MLTVSTTSWHFRIYDHWRNKIARKPPSQIDLCHYMRAIMLYTTGYYLGLGLLFAFLGLFILVGGALLALTSPVWGPFYLMHRRKPGYEKRAIRRAFAWTNPVVDWLRDHGDRLLIGFAVGVFILWFALMSMKTWWLGIAICAIAFAAIILVLLLVLAGASFFKWYGPRRRAKLAMRPPEAPKPRKSPKPAKGPGALRLLWLWIKAKKKRICPLIQTNETVQS